MKPIRLHIAPDGPRWAVGHVVDDRLIVLGYVLPRQPVSYYRRALRGIARTLLVFNAGHRALFYRRAGRPLNAIERVRLAQRLTGMAKNVEHMDTKAVRRLKSV